MADPRQDEDAPEPTPVPPIDEAPSSTGVVVPEADEEE
jgi:hypothetical protein